jgi:hypothetical protein
MRVPILTAIGDGEHSRPRKRCPVLELVVVILIVLFLFGGLRFGRR